MTRIKICSLIAAVCFFPAILLGAGADVATRNHQGHGYH